MMSKITEKSILGGHEFDAEPEFIHRLFEENIKRNNCGGKIALIYEEGHHTWRTTYNQLNQDANKLAATILNVLRTMPSRPNQDGDWIIGVCMKPSDAVVVTLLAVMKTGCAYLPLNPFYQEARVKHSASEAKPVLIIHDNDFKFTNQFSSFRAYTFSELLRMSVDACGENIPDDMTLTKGNPNTKIIALYTSGSSGLPKGVRNRHHSFFHRIMWQLKSYPYHETEQFCVFKTSLLFTDHMAELWCPLISSKTVVVVPRETVKNPEMFVPILDRYEIQRLLGVPSLLKSVLMYLKMVASTEKRRLLQSMQMWISSGEVLTIKLAKEFFEYFGDDRKLLNLYGCTEINSEACSFEMTSRQQVEKLEKIPLGRVFPNTKVYLLDAEQKIVEKGVIGEIYVAGVMVTDGYIADRSPGSFMKNMFETDEPYDHMYRTGDFGVIYEDLLYFEGRRDAQIKVRGHRVDLSEIEKILTEIGYIAQSVILVHHAGKDDQALVAFLKTKDYWNMKPVEIELDLRERMSAYMIPQVIIVESFPQLSNGKVDRQALLNMYAERCASRLDLAKIVMDFTGIPSNRQATAKKVFEIIGESIGQELRDKISANANFFHLGGNSLNAILTVMNLSDRGYYISLTDFLRARRLEEVLIKVSTMQHMNEFEMKVDMKLSREAIGRKVKEEVIEIISSSFKRKSDIDQFLAVTEEHFRKYITELWDHIVYESCSFIVRNELQEIIGVTINFDLSYEPSVNVPKPLSTTLEFLYEIERPVVNTLLYTGNRVLHCNMMATAEKLSAQQNIDVICFMEQHVLNLAKERGFTGVLTTNSNPLTAQLGSTVFGYFTLSEVQLNRFTDKTGDRPYSKAPDSLKIIVAYKPLKYRRH